MMGSVPQAAPAPYQTVILQILALHPQTAPLPKAI